MDRNSAPFREPRRAGARQRARCASFPPRVSAARRASATSRGTAVRARPAEPPTSARPAARRLSASSRRPDGDGEPDAKLGRRRGRVDPAIVRQRQQSVEPAGQHDRIGVRQLVPGQQSRHHDRRCDRCGNRPSSGVWQFFPNGGSEWVNFPTVGPTSALLLSANDMIRFVPKSTFIGRVSLKALAWDGSVGADGMTVNPAKLAGRPSRHDFDGHGLGQSRADVDRRARLLLPQRSPSTPRAAAIAVSRLLTQAGYADPDGKGLPQGIAIIGASLSGGRRSTCSRAEGGSRCRASQRRRPFCCQAMRRCGLWPAVKPDAK